MGRPLSWLPRESRSQTILVQGHFAGLGGSCRALDDLPNGSNGPTKSGVPKVKQYSGR